jgi:hypothetical protein
MSRRFGTYGKGRVLVSDDVIMYAALGLMPGKGTRVIEHTAALSMHCSTLFAIEPV